MRTFWTTSDLLARGKSEREISGASRRGALTPVRKGHFAVPGAPGDLVRAVRIGGVVTATSASRALGLWTPPDPIPGDHRDAFGRRVFPNRLQVAVPSSAGRLRSPDDSRLPFVPSPAVVLHWTPPRSLLGTEATRIASPMLLVHHAFLSLPPERALAILDSALHLRFLRVADLPAIAAALPSHLRPVVLAADPRADAGTETIARYFLRLLGLRVEPQARIDDLGAVDLLVEGRLIVETDGREWHDGDTAFAADRRRDLVAARGRYRVLRFTWQQVLFQWPEVEAAVLAALAA